MSPSFIHAADIHLGYRQYHCQDRAWDFHAAFSQMADDAIKRRVDFVLLAGDLFHKRSIDPMTLLQATQVMERLRDSDIPIIIIEGNHEKPHRLTDASWIDFLSQSGLAIALDAPYEDRAMQFEPWTRETQGAYIDLPGPIRVVGVRYSGAATGRVIEDLAEQMAQNPAPAGTYTIVMLHAGIEGVIDRYSASVSRASMDVLRPHCDYLALGHVHKPYTQDDWLYNPGSLETNSTDEVAWADRGYLCVECQPGDCASHTVTRIRSKRRPFLLLRQGVDAFATPNELYQAMDDLARQHSALNSHTRAVVQLRLNGILQFSRGDLDTRYIQTLLEERLQPLIAIVKDETTPNEMEIRLSQSESRPEVERHVITELATRDARSAADAAAWADLALDLKRLALAGSDSAEVIETLGQFVDRSPSTVDAPQEGEQV